MHNDSIFDMSYIKDTCNKPCIRSYVYEHHGFFVEQLPMIPVSGGHLTIPVQSFLGLFRSSS